MSLPAFAVPGDHLSSSSKHTVGLGTHVHASNLYASVAGPVASSRDGGKKAPPTVSIPGSSNATSSSDVPTAAQGAVTPSVGDVVLGRVTRTNPRQATIDVLSLGMTGAQVLREPFQALIRQQDIRATEQDKVKMAESFRVGDVVRGVVISLGDERNYYVSTARNEFGVVLARSEMDNQMVPVSWREMKDLSAGVNELRKVSKVV